MTTTMATHPTSPPADEVHLAQEACSNAEAFGDTLAGLRLSEGLPGMSDQFLVESMVGIVTAKIALQPVWEGCQRHAWNEQQLRQFQDELSAIHSVESLKRGLRTERTSSVLTFDHLGSSAEGGSWLFRHGWPQGWIQRSKVAGCTYLQEDLDVLSAAGTSGFLKRRAEGATRNKQLAEAAVRWTTPSIHLVGLVLPATEKLLVSAVRAEAFVTLARTACAMERHRLAHGGYPGDLAELVPAYLAAVPIDVIDGQPLHYRRGADGGFKLWSIGNDGHDDDGTPVKSKEADESGDWVWLQSPVSSAAGN